MTQERFNIIKKHANEVYDSFDKLGANLSENEYALSDDGKSKLYLWELANDKQPNVQDEPTAESGSAPLAEAAFEHRAGGGSAPSFCSASEVSDNQDQYYSVGFEEFLKKYAFKIHLDPDEVVCINALGPAEEGSTVEIVFRGGGVTKATLDDFCPGVYCSKKII